LTPIEMSMVRWVALRGAVTSLHVATIHDRATPDELITMTAAMGLRLVEAKPGAASVADLTPGRLTEAQRDAALTLGATVYGLLIGYERVAKMPMPDANSYPPFAALADATALDCIAWSAAALLRIGYAQQALPNVPEPDALTEPGWYNEPALSGPFQRYWDGTDWTASVRGKLGTEQAASLRPSEREPGQGMALGQQRFRKQANTP
jgi:hypothetical protein